MNRYELEQEFNKLVSELRQRIQYKKEVGELSNDEADDLLYMTNQQITTFSDGWNSSGCTINNLHYSPDQPGWSSSSC